MRGWQISLGKFQLVIQLFVCDPALSPGISFLSFPPSEYHSVEEIDVKKSGSLEIPFLTVMTTLGILKGGNGGSGSLGSVPKASLKWL